MIKVNKQAISMTNLPFSVFSLPFLYSLITNNQERITKIPKIILITLINLVAPFLSKLYHKSY